MKFFTGSKTMSWTFVILTKILYIRSRQVRSGAVYNKTFHGSIISRNPMTPKAASYLTAFLYITSDNLPKIIKKIKSQIKINWNVLLIIQKPGFHPE